MDVDVDPRSLQGFQITTKCPSRKRFQSKFVNNISLNLFQSFTEANSLKNLEDFMLTDKLFVSGHRVAAWELDAKA